jgi:hypothetical protein
MAVIEKLNHTPHAHQNVHLEILKFAMAEPGNCQVTHKIKQPHVRDCHQ